MSSESGAPLGEMGYVGDAVQEERAVIEKLAGEKVPGSHIRMLARFVLSLDKRLAEVCGTAARTESRTFAANERLDAQEARLQAVEAFTQGFEDAEKGSRGLTVEERDAYRRTRARLFEPFEPVSQSSTKTPGADMEQADGERERLAEAVDNARLEFIGLLQIAFPQARVSIDKNVVALLEAAAALRSSAQKDGEQEAFRAGFRAAFRVCCMGDKALCSVFSPGDASEANAWDDYARQPSSAPVTPEERVERVEGWAWWSHVEQAWQLAEDEPSSTKAKRASLLIHSATESREAPAPGLWHAAAIDAVENLAGRIAYNCGLGVSEWEGFIEEAVALVNRTSKAVHPAQPPSEPDAPPVEPITCQDYESSEEYSQRRSRLRAAPVESGEEDAGEWSHAERHGAAQPAQPVAWMVEYRDDDDGSVWKVSGFHSTQEAAVEDKSDCFTGGWRARTFPLYRSAPPAPSEIDEDAVEELARWLEGYADGAVEQDPSWKAPSFRDDARRLLIECGLSPAPISQPTELTREQMRNKVIAAFGKWARPVSEYPAEADRLLSELFPAKGDARA